MSGTGRCCLPVADRPGLLAAAGPVFDLVWRTDFTAPGFAAVEVPPGIDSPALRGWMVAFKEQLSETAVGRGSDPFAYRSMGRFDQQETTKFHLDGAPDRSLLMLGYEPSRVRSRLFLAGYARAAFELGITPRQYLQDHNPMYREERLDRYVTELPPQADGHSRILLINNSALPFSDARTNPLGVLHKAIIVTPDDAEQRLVNSIMLAVGPRDEVDSDRQQEFVTTDRISQKVY